MKTAIFVALIATTCFAQRIFPEAEGRVQIFYDQLSTLMNETQCRFVATHSVGTQKVPLTLINRIRAYNTNFLLLHYELAFGAGDIFNLEGGSWVSDWDSVNPHDDWFIHAAGGERCRQTDWNWYLMDMSGGFEGAVPGWKEYWVRRALRRMGLNDCDGIFADSHNMPWNMDHYPPLYAPPSDGGLGAAYLTFDNYIMSRLHTDSTEYKYIPNVGAWVTSWDYTDYSHCDGLMIENYSSWDCYNHFEPEDWQLEADRILNIAGMGKILILQQTIDFWSPQCRNWMIANYFLLKNRKTYLNLILDPESEWCEYGYFNPTWLGEYNINLGTFIGGVPANIAALYNATYDVYVRNYERGMVFVNPTWNSRNIILPSTYYILNFSGGGCVWSDGTTDETPSITFTPTSAFTLEPMSGIIITYTNTPMTIVSDNFDATTHKNIKLSAYYAQKQLFLSKDNKFIDDDIEIIDFTGRNIGTYRCLHGKAEISLDRSGVYFVKTKNFGNAKFIIAY